MALFGFIGAGNMGYPLLQAAVRSFGKDEVIYYDVSDQQRNIIYNNTKIEASSDNISVAKECKYLVLAVKPIFLSDVLKQISSVLTNKHVIISVVAGVTIDSIKKLLSQDLRIIRSMPNTPALLSKGMTGISLFEDEYNEAELEVINQFFSSLGKYEIFNENLMNAVTCANGSSPAYVYMFIEALADSVVSLGIPRDKAYTLVAQTVYGAASMVLETNEHPASLKDKICSPGGTTIEGVKALEEHGFRKAIIKATEACYNKAESIGETDEKL